MVQKTIVVRIVGDAGQFVGSMAAAGTAVQTMGNQVAGASAKATTSVSRFGQIAGTVGKITTLGVAAGLALSAKAAIDFESAFAGVRKTVNASESGFTILKEDIRSLALEIPIAATELARIGELGGQLGVGIGGLPTFIETIAEVGVTTDLSTEQAAIGFARLDNIMQLNQKSFRNIGSAVVDLGNNFATTESEILTFSLRIAPAAATVGITTDEVLAMATAFSSVGIPAERGGTAVQKAIFAIDDAARSGGTSLRIFADIAGTTVDEFRTLAEDDPAQAFVLFVEGLKTARDEGKDVSQVLKDVGLGTERVKQSLLATANASGVLQDALDTSASAWEENIALTEEAEKRFGTTASKIQLAKNQMYDMAVTIGDELLPRIGNIADGFGDFLSGVENATPAIKILLGVIVGGIAGLTLAGTAYKILTRIIGVDMVAAMNRGAVASAFLKGAIGGGLLLAVGFLVQKFVEYGQTQRDIELRVDNLVDALDEERRGMEGLTLARIKDQLVAEGQLDLLNRLGIGLDTFGRAVLGDASAAKFVNDTLSGLKENYEGLKTASAEYSLGVGDQADAYERLQAIDSRQLYRDIGDAQSLLSRGTEEVTLAQERLNRNLLAAERSANLEAQRKGYDSVGEAWKEAALSGQVYNTVVRNSGDEAAKLSDELTGDVASAIQDYSDSVDDAFKETKDNILGQISLWDAMGDAVVINVDDAIEAIGRQVSTQREFVLNASAFNPSEGVQSLFDNFTLEQQAGFNKLVAEGGPDARRYVDFLESIFGPGGEIVQTALIAFGTRLPAIVKAGGTEMIQSFSEIVDKVQEDDPTVNPVEAWLGVMETALNTAPERLKPSIVQGIYETFKAGNFSGEMFGLGEDAMQGFIDGMYELFPELARLMFGMRNTVVSVFKSGFEARSPSRLMARLGHMVGAGFAQGIDESAQRYFPGASPDFLRTGVVSQMASSSTSTVNNNQSAPTTVIINQSQHRDLRSDISSGLREGGVTRQVETLVKR